MPECSVPLNKIVETFQNSARSSNTKTESDEVLEPSVSDYDVRLEAVTFL